MAMNTRSRLLPDDGDTSSSVLLTSPDVSYSISSDGLKDLDSHSKQLQKPNVLANCDRVLRTVFGHTVYRGKQKAIMRAAVSGADVFVIAPTGMGKSLCFQVPAVADQHGITIVVSPLLALMKNQADRLREKDVPVVAFTSETPPLEKQEIVEDLSSRNPRTRLLYITPEKLFTTAFITLLKGVHERKALNRLVIDEARTMWKTKAHCISEWGHDFRAEYRRLGTFREMFNDVPIMALTATANPTVQNDIITTLRMSPDRLFKAMHPFNRANLFYEIRYNTSPLQHVQMMNVFEYITILYRRRGRPSAGIVYCRTKKTCDDLSSFLSGKGINARPYYRGIHPAKLDQTLRVWEVGGSGQGGVDVVCATVAFGMGIDKSDVRYIIHYDLPKSFEGYYQETGRAGRDGLPAKCILYYSREDVIRVRKWVSSTHAKRAHAAERTDGPAPSQRAVNSLDALIDFAESTTVCRHVSICRYFGEKIDRNDLDVMKRYCDSMCDVCKYPEKTRLRKAQLSSEEYAGTQVAREPSSADFEDDEGVKLQNCADGHNELTHLKHGGLRDSMFKQSLKSQGSKRANAEACSSASKRSKPCGTLPLPIASSKQFNSVSSLCKPFRTPFKVVPIPEPVQHRSPVRERALLPVEIENDDLVEVGPQPQAPAVNLPEVDIELELPSSMKVQYPLRQNAFITLRKALHKIFMLEKAHMWTRVKYAPTREKTRNEVLARVAKDLEFAAYSLCSTSQGYRFRTTEKEDAVRMLALEQAWETAENQKDELEDAREVAEIVRTACKALKNEGNTRARED